VAGLTSGSTSAMSPAHVPTSVAVGGGHVHEATGSGGIAERGSRLDRKRQQRRRQNCCKHSRMNLHRDLLHRALPKSTLRRHCGGTLPFRQL